jgi:hypothetical protein
MKICTGCLQLKDDSLFYQDNRNADGLNYKCKECNSEYLKKYYGNQENKNRRNDNVRSDNKNNPIKGLLARAKLRAKTQDKEFSLAEKDISIPEFCPIFKIPLFVSNINSSYNSISIDRIDNHRGYTPDNIIIVSWKANKIKSQASLNEMTLINTYFSNQIETNKSTIHPILNDRKYIKELLRSANKRAIAKNLEFSLTEKDIIIPYLCPILNYILEKADKMHDDYSPSIDRIDNNLGYTKNNIKIISYRANILKNNASSQDYALVFNFYKKLLEHHNEKQSG